VELLFAVLGGIICGAVAHVILPWRAARGVLLGPAVAGAVAAVLWEALTWAGWKYGDTWIWVIALVGGGVVALLVEWILSPRREHADAHYFSHAKAAGQV
jgi:uncharacterized membrane protein YeaQ/YmgE (transglycosylase-associated protein family)